MNLIKLSDYVIDFFKQKKINEIFMLPGGGCMHLVNSLKTCNINYICCLHEQSASIAALAYSQYKNDIGVALVTSGPGATNAITGVLGAWIESAPLIIISGEVKTKDMVGHLKIRSRGVQEAPIIDIIKPITKFSVTVLKKEKIKYYLEKAFHIANNGRKGPVWIDIPLDIQDSYININDLENYTPEIEIPNINNQIEKTLQMINNSKKPIILAGYGIRLSNSVNQFLKFIEKYKIPFLTTWKAIDISPYDNKLFMGRPGTAGQRAANFIQQNSDLIITIGARLDFPQIGYNQKDFARDARKIIIDIEEDELNKFEFDIDLKINCSAKQFIDEMLDKDCFNKNSFDEWIKHCENLNKKYPVVTKDLLLNNKFVNQYALSFSISKHMTPDDIFAPGSSGMGSDIPMQTLKIKSGQRVINSPGIGSMGFGIPTAIGVCIASNYRRTICTNGDGGFQMNIQELQTIKRLNLPIKFFVLNNDGYASIRNTQRSYFDGQYVASNNSSGITLPNLFKIANAYGINYKKINNNNELNFIKDVLESDGPFICEIMVDPNETSLYKTTSIIKSDGKSINKPFEDLFPFLEREEYKSNFFNY